MKSLVAAVLLLLAWPAWSETFGTVRPESSRIGFVFTEMGVEVQGRFARFTTDLTFDPARPESAHVAIAIDLAGTDAGSREANDTVLGKPWFDAGSYPVARFESRAVQALGGNRYQAVGRLAIKGRTRDAVVPFTFARQGADAVFDGGLVVRRSDFAIGEGEWADPGLVADAVQVRFHIQAAARPSGK